MKKGIIVIICSLSSICLFSQIDTQTGLTIQNLVEDTLINGCIQVSNVTVNSSGAYGYFKKNGSQFPFESGIVLASGPIANAEGPNSSGSLGGSLGSGSDPDLAAIASGYTIYDATVVQFDFIPATDTVLFDYIFGSEEFPEYANSSFNDVFGFFLSGPGINGPYSNNAINIAILPNNHPVTIDNVHHSSYYTAYPTSGSTSAGSYTGAVQYDGNTIQLTAFAIVQACETYHIKLAVGDAGDSAYDSGVFLEAGSFVSGESISVINSAQVGGEADLWEGCENFYVVAREEGSEADQEITINVTVDDESTATEGIDFTDFPTEITLEVGQMTDTIFYSAYNDGDDEGHETIIVAFYTACPCGNQSTAVYDTIWIYDAEFIKGGIQDMETFFCGTEVPPTLDLVGECNIDPNVLYYWSTSETTSTITIVPQVGSTTYYLTMTDLCGNEVFDSVTIRVSDINLDDYVITPPSCFNECDGSIQLSMSGAFPPFQYRYANILYQYFPDSVHNTSFNTFNNLCPATYKITVTDDVGCFLKFEYTLPNPPSVNLSAGILEGDMEFCSDPGTITLSAESNQPNPVFLWSNASIQSSISVTPNIGENDYWVRIFDACDHFMEDHVTIVYSNIQITTSSQFDNGTCNGQVIAFATNGIEPYNYFWQAPIADFGSTFNNLCYGDYYVQVTDNIGCQKTETQNVPLNVSVPNNSYEDILSIFPNPASDNFVIKYKDDDYKDILVKIIDIKGSIVFESNLIENEIEIKGFNTGIYFVNLYKSDAVIAVQKLIITK
ncbi:MAG TPA: choice-of-anchor L domain-containing protein [Bacteroidales bacterium]|nr:choice-of-anchor L domain-containing protein [Bacteroidales bacterium]